MRDKVQPIESTKIHGWGHHNLGSFIAWLKANGGMSALPTDLVNPTSCPSCDSPLRESTIERVHGNNTDVFRCLRCTSRKCDYIQQTEFKLEAPNMGFLLSLGISALMKRAKLGGPAAGPTQAPFLLTGRPFAVPDMKGVPLSERIVRVVGLAQGVGMTMQEIRAALGLDASVPNARLTELKRRGLLKKSGQYRGALPGSRGASKNGAEVWVIPAFAPPEPEGALHEGEAAPAPDPAPAPLPERKLKKRHPKPRA